MYITRIGRQRHGLRKRRARLAGRPGTGHSAGRRASDYPLRDLFATILELAGVHVPKTVPNSTGDGIVTLDSVSITPILFTGVKEPA